MRAVLFEGPDILRIVEIPRPDPAPGEVRLNILLAGICATDVHILHGRFPVRPPRVLGHELAGVVEAVGSGVSPDWVGKTCGVSPARFCGVCAACRDGCPELCLSFECLGNTRDGGYAEAACVPAGQLVDLPGAPAEQLVWLEPLACVIQALEACQAAQSRSVLVLGAGVLGRLMLQTLKLASRARLAVADPNLRKTRLALAAGAEQAWVVPHTGAALEIDAQIRRWASEGVQTIIDTSGSPEAIERALGWAAPAGRVLLFGVPDPEARFPLHPELVFRKELHILASAGMTPPAFERAVALLRQGRLDLAGLVSEVIGLEEVPQVIHDRERLSAGKILIQPGRGQEPLRRLQSSEVQG